MVSGPAPAPGDSSSAQSPGWMSIVRQNWDYKTMRHSGDKFKALRTTTTRCHLKKLGELTQMESNAPETAARGGGI